MTIFEALPGPRALSLFMDEPRSLRPGRRTKWSELHDYLVALN